MGILIKLLCFSPREEEPFKRGVGVGTKNKLADCLNEETLSQMDRLLLVEGNSKTREAAAEGGGCGGGE